jgi:hypothetical protein
MVLAPPVLIKRPAAVSKLAVAAVAAAVCSLLLLALAGAAAAEELGRTIALKSGEEATFDAAVANGLVVLGPRLSRPSAEQPKEGQIAVSFVKRGLAPYGDLTAVEKTSAPVDFVATGLIGNIKIDEVVICGRLDGPVAIRIAAGSWRVSLNRFFVHRNDQATTGEGDLGCPK